jgi:hypothetical protein
MALKSFDTYMAENGMQSTLDDLKKTYKYDAAKAQYEQQGYYGSGGKASSTGTGYGSTTGSSYNLNDIISSLQSTINNSLGTVTSNLSNLQNSLGTAYQNKSSVLSGQLDTVNKQYEDLLSQISSQGTLNEASQAKVTNSELAKRGVTSDSTAAQQEVVSALAPVKQQTASNTLTANSAKTSAASAIAEAIANIPIEQKTQESQIAQTIASILSGGANTAISSGSNLYSQLLSAEQANSQTDAEKLYQDLQNQLLQKQLSSSGSTNYVTLGAGQALYDPTTGKVVYTNPSSSSNSTNSWE